MIHVLLLAAALAADAAAVAAALAVSTRSRAVVVRAAVVFGLFQAGMAGLGALGGTWLSAWLGPWLGWIAFVVLAALGARMLAADAADEVPEQVGLKVLVSLAVATSIDALAAGVSLPVFALPVFVSIAVIGMVTFALALASGLGGQALGERFGLVAQKLGGLVLIGVGVAALFG